MGKIRRAVAEQAERAGFGRVVRVHRERQEAVPAAGLAFAAFIPAGIATAVMAAEESDLWRLPALGWAVLAWAAAARVWWGPVDDPKGRRWFVAAEGGLVVWRPSATRPPAVPWHDLRLERARAQTIWLTWQAGGRKRTLVVPLMSGRAELLRAAGRGRPSPPLSVRRLALPVAFALASALMLWFTAVPLAVDAVRDAPNRRHRRPCSWWGAAVSSTATPA